MSKTVKLLSLRKEVALVILFKICFLIVLWQVCFSHSEKKPQIRDLYQHVVATDQTDVYTVKGE